jgi:phosphonate transport system ATP-binding protein
MNSVAISLQQVCCVADGRALLDVETLGIRHGERVAIVGHNGAGKSTLLRLLTGFMPTAHGTVDVLGHELTASPAARELRALRREVGQIHQGLHLVGRLSALENVLIGSLGRVVGWRSWVRLFPAVETAKAEAALHAVGLLARAQTRADKLSGGERQKVAIARLLVQQPKLILADEPTAALDPAAAGEVCHLLAQAARNSTLISVVHNPSLLPLLADRVIGLKSGRIAFDLPLAAVDDQKLTHLYRPDEAAPAAPWQLPEAPGARCFRAGTTRRQNTSYPQEVIEEKS